MKKMISIPIFFICFVLCLGVIKLPKLCVATTNERIITIEHEDMAFSYTESELITNNKYSDIFTTQELLKRIYRMGFSIKESISYVYGGLNCVVAEICDKINAEPFNARLDVTTGYPYVVEDKVGKKVDIDCLYRDLFCLLISDIENINIRLKVFELDPVNGVEDVKLLAFEKSSFITYINGSNQEGRIQNIKRALGSINGKELLPNESMSFNELIGETTKENGYALAKVILNGKYEDDYGGGVCQAATTLYNSALIAGLEIEKVRPHSLKVGYVAGSFDAMVSAGVSDLVIKNPYDTPVYIHTYATDYECGVKIFGAVNEYEIKRRTEIIEFDEEELPDVSYKSEGFLDYYQNNELVKSKKIRKDTYKKVKVEENPA